MATGDAEGRIEVWDVPSRTRRASQKHFHFRVSGLADSHDERTRADLLGK